MFDLIFAEFALTSIIAITNAKLNTILEIINLAIVVLLILLSLFIAIKLTISYNEKFSFIYDGIDYSKKRGKLFLLNTYI